ncbi:unnamed protein product [Rangifer tarandus platyrhynchus]|uniref:Uncharacterized protein n=1 Tax=Rangifer tarandus platyrhynchus TaxID=3082113 RepID=A0ABN8YDA4_RANTA|nr:unnamed protein product [Rangifer tarandus platyrhynchus]
MPMLPSRRSHPPSLSCVHEPVRAVSCVRVSFPAVARLASLFHSRRQLTTHHVDDAASCSEGHPGVKRTAPFRQGVSSLSGRQLPGSEHSVQCLTAGRVSQANHSPFRKPAGTLATACRVPLFPPSRQEAEAPDLMPFARDHSFVFPKAPLLLLK